MNRGRPLAWSIREAIRARAAQGESRRKIADALAVAKATVDKYARKKSPPEV